MTDDQQTLLRVRNKTELAHGVVGVEFEAADGSDLPAWQPGAHVEFILPGDMRRQFSLCGDPADRSTWRIAVLLEPESRGGSEYVHQQLETGQTITGVGPRNHFALVDSDHYIFIAGGIGITPIIPMLSAATAKGASWELVYGGRTRKSMAYAADLVDQFGEAVAVRPQDETGLLDLGSVLGAIESGTTVYCCGPGPLLDAVESFADEWSSGTLHVERFVPKPILDDDALDEFEVELVESGQTLRVLPGVSILETVENAGIYVEASCREGTCGTCETAVVGGRPAHRDSLLGEEEREASESMMICVSRSHSPRLELEL